MNHLGKPVMTDTDQNWIALDNTGLVSTLKKKISQLGSSSRLETTYNGKGSEWDPQKLVMPFVAHGNLETSKSQTMLITNHCTGRILGCGTPILGHVVTWQAMFARANTCSWQWNVFPLASVCSITVSHSYLPSVTLVVSFRIFPESVSAKGSSNSGGLSNIFTSSHLPITSSNPHIFSSSHPHIFTSSHLHIFSSSHLLIFTSAHPHIFSSSHLLIFTSSHLLILTSSHPHILTSSHPHIFTSSHLHIFSSSHHIFSSSHLLIFTSSHGHIITYSHVHIFIFSLALLLSCPLLFTSFLFLS